jgi:hypothetical protein
MSDMITTPPATPETPDEQNARECRERCSERLTALLVAAKRLRSENLSQDDRDAIRDELRPLSIEQRRQLKILLSWGGPSDGFVLTFDNDEHDLIEGIYFHADWFTYAEQRLSQTEAELVMEMYLDSDPAYFLGA